MRNLDHIPQVRIRIASHARFHLEAKGKYDIIREGNITRYVPVGVIRTCFHPTGGLKTGKRITWDNTIVASGIDIGIKFHWQRRVVMTLPGVVEVVNNGDGTSELFNILDAETYLTSVISSEMNPDAPLEFLKAHAIISRSWLAGKLLDSHPAGSMPTATDGHHIIRWEDTSDHDGFDVCGDDHCQRYQGVDRVNAAALRAVTETCGRVIRDAEGNPADARFSKCCGGRTELFSTCWQDVDFPYLPSKIDPWCDLCQMDSDDRDRILDTIMMGYDRRTVDFHDWETVVTPGEVRRNFRSRYGNDCGVVTGIDIDRRGPSGRAKSIILTTESGQYTIGKELEIRRLLSGKCLYSSNFEIHKEGNGNFRLTGHGWGHGVGLCQIGAAVMAHYGKSCAEILDFYYPTTNIDKIY